MKALKRGISFCKVFYINIWIHVDRERNLAWHNARFYLFIYFKGGRGCHIGPGWPIDKTDPSIDTGERSRNK